MSGSLLQNLGRRPARLALWGVADGPGALAFTQKLEAKFRDGKPVSFTPDIIKDAGIDQMIIEDFRLQDLAGKPNRFAYVLTLREFLKPLEPDTAPSIDTGILGDAANLAKGILGGLDIGQAFVSGLARFVPTFRLEDKMAQTNLFEDLRNALKDFKGFLDQNVPLIKPAIQSLKAIVPQITELIDKLITLMGELKTEIQKLLSSGPIQNLDKVTQFTAGITTLLTTAKTVVPAEAATIDDVLKVAQLAGSLPTIGQLKDEINSLIDAIVAHLNSLKS